MDTWAVTLEESRLMPNKIISSKPQQDRKSNIKSINSTALSFKTANSSLIGDETVSFFKNILRL